MKIFKIVLGSLVLSTFSCTKTGSPSVENADPTLQQKEQVLKDDAGESISVVYFAEGNDVAVHLKKAGKEHKLTAKGTNDKGEPIFTDGEMAWEMAEDGHSGKLTEKNAGTKIFK